MNILSAEKISKSYSEKVLFDEISLGIDEGEKIGLIGINGTGKTTLLKVLAGIESPDRGRIITGNGMRTEYLPQSPDFEGGTTVLQQVFKGSSPVMTLLREYEDVLHRSEEMPGDEQLEKRLLSLTQKMDNLQAWTVESEAKTILTRLGITEFDADVAFLSGGQRKRIALASALIHPAELLILDEPTNHLDNTTVEWLEKYLNSRRGALLMVTHDRYFLGRVSNRIIELDNGRLFIYQANYDKYLEMKLEREELEQASERKRRNLLRNELAWIRQGAQARSTKQKARIERFEKLKDEKGPAAAASVEIKAAASRLGRKIIELEHVDKAFDGTEVVKDFSYILLRDDRIGIIGPNGAGKSTLLKLVSGILEPDAGRVSAGETVKIGFFTQENDEMDGSLRVIEYIREAAEYINTGDGTVTAAQMLERFLFPPAMQWTPLAKLSGGEKRRLYLLRVLMGAPNILLLDEPTNDLDIQTLTILESYLDEFPGAVIAVSHDRYFLDRVVDRIFLMTGDSRVQQFEGNYTDFREKADAMQEEPSSSMPAGRGNVQNKAGAESAPGVGSRPGTGAALETGTGNTAVRKDRLLKFTYKEQKEFEQIDGVIAGLEQELDRVKSEIEKSSADFEKLQKLLAEQEQLESRLNEAMERWVYLNELAEAIAEGGKVPGG